MEVKRIDGLDEVYTNLKEETGVDPFDVQDVIVYTNPANLDCGTPEMIFLMSDNNHQYVKVETDYTYFDVLTACGRKAARYCFHGFDVCSCDEEKKKAAAEKYAEPVAHFTKLRMEHWKRKMELAEKLRPRKEKIDYADMNENGNKKRRFE